MTASWTLSCGIQLNAQGETGATRKVLIYARKTASRPSLRQTRHCSALYLWHCSVLMGLVGVANCLDIQSARRAMHLLLLQQPPTCSMRWPFEGHSCSLTHTCPNEQHPVDHNHAHMFRQDSACRLSHAPRGIMHNYNKVPIAFSNVIKDRM